MIFRIGRLLPGGAKGPGENETLESEILLFHIYKVAIEIQRERVNIDSNPKPFSG